MPVLHSLAHERLQRRDVHRRAAGVRADHAQHGELGCDRLAGAGGSADEYIGVGVVRGVEHLRLHGVEVAELEDALEGRIAQSRLGERPQLEQLCVRRRRRRQRELRERERRGRLATEPAVRDGANIVLRRQRLEERDGECERARLVLLLLVQRPQFLVVDVLRLRVLHPHPPVLDRAVHPIAPLEVGADREHHAQHRARDWLRRHVDGDAREHRHLRLDRRRMPLVGDERADVTHAHLAERVDPHLLALELCVDVGGQAPHLPEHAGVGPHALLELFGEPEDSLRIAEPALAQRDLEEAAREARRRLRDEVAVGDQCEGADGRARDVRLREDVGLALLGSEPRRDHLERAVRRLQLLELLHLLLAHLHLPKLGGAADGVQDVGLGAARVPQPGEGLDRLHRDVEMGGGSAQLGRVERARRRVEAQQLALVEPLCHRPD
mmetsp:Transcript_19570/g.44987  ORF Transcript_19570/g.44987 Transcript_19570/m.44987 type:complete len:439 (-) Transcript_19570:445-1761(-)